MSQHFYYGVYLPSVQRAVYFRELTIRQLKIIIKSILNGDDTALSMCFNDVIKDNCKEDIDAIDLTVLDRFIILLNMRVISIGAEQSLQLTCDETQKTFTYTINYNDIVAQLEAIKLDSNMTSHYENITIEYGVPLARLSHQIPNNLSRYDNLTRAVRGLKIGDSQFKLVTMDFYSLSRIIESIPKAISDEILVYLEAQGNKVNRVKYINSKNPYTDKKIEQSMTLDDIDLLRLLKLAYKEDLHALYKSIYYMVHVLHFDAEYVEKLTVNEKNLLYTFYLADEQEKREAKPELPKAPKANVLVRSALEDFENEMSNSG